MLMKRRNFIFGIILLLIMAGCCQRGTGREDQRVRFVPFTGEAQILQSWQGDYPVSRLDQFPPKQRERGVGFFNSPETFKNVWENFNPGKALPEIDFSRHLVIFSRNREYYNRIKIGKVDVKDGVAEVLAMETMSAIPIEDKFAISIAVVFRQGIIALKSGEEIIPVDDQ